MGSIKLYYNIGHYIMIVSQIMNLNLFCNYSGVKEVSYKCNICFEKYRRLNLKSNRKWEYSSEIKVPQILPLYTK